MVIEGNLNAAGHAYAIIVSRFNGFITERLLEGAMDCIVRHGGERDKVDVIRVPGAFEIPLVAQRVASSKKYDALICVGAVIKGQTSHFDFVASESSKGIAHVALSTGVPVIFGVLMTSTIEEALDRAGTKNGNKGWDAALAAIETVNLFRQIS